MCVCVEATVPLSETLWLTVPVLALPQGVLHYNREKTSWYEGEWLRNKKEGWGVRWCVLTALGSLS